MTEDRTHLTERDVGKRIVDADGDELGVVAGVSGNRVEIDPDPGMLDQMKTRFGWKDREQDTYAIEQTRVDRVTPDEVRLAGE